MKLFDFNIDFLQKKFFKKQQTIKGDTRNTSDTTHIPLPSFPITIPLRKPVTVEPLHSLIGLRQIG